MDTLCTENQEGREGMWNPATEERFSECQENFKIEELEESPGTTIINIYVFREA